MFGLCQVYSFVEYLRSKLDQEDFLILFKAVVGVIIGAAVVAGGVATYTG